MSVGNVSSGSCDYTSNILIHPTICMNDIEAFKQCLPFYTNILEKRYSRHEAVRRAENRFNLLISHYENNSSTVKTLVFKDHNDPVSFVFYDIDSIPESVYIMEVAVSHDYQRQGIGSMMINMLIDQHPDKNRFYLITPQTLTSAHNFWKRVGFKQSAFVREGFNSADWASFEYIRPRQSCL